MPIRILHGDIHLIDLKTRLPFKYGIATMTQAPQAFVRLFVDVDGQEFFGIAADVLPPKWFTKVPDKPLDAEIDEMLAVIDHAVDCSIGAIGPTVFEVWRDIFARQNAWGRERGFPPLLTHFGTSLVERALIESFCKAAGRPFGEVVRTSNLGIRLESFDRCLAGRVPADLLPPAPRRKIIARHTVGMADPLTDEEIEPPARLHDGLPQSLAECVRRYGLKHFKIKLSGQAEQDIQRLIRVAGVINKAADGDFAFSLDGNESFRSLDSFQEYWQALTRRAELLQFFRRMLFVEQPFHRDVALNAEVLCHLAAWEERPTLIIDESDAELDSLPRALALGHHGTSHKNCKGVFKGIANACLLAALRHYSADRRLVMSGEDLANIGPVALLQDLAVVATLGVNSVERNGHHYFAGLSAFPQSIGEQILKAHGDLYTPALAGWPTLRIAAGELSFDSVVAAPLGVGIELDVTQFTPRKNWTSAEAFQENTT